MVELRPNLTERENFLFRAYFGPDADFLSRAYRDMNRTLRGIRKDRDSEKILKSAKEQLKERLRQLTKGNVPTTAEKLAEEFDHWHFDSSNELIRFYGKLSPPFKFTYGHAQKWINMTFKYYWYFGGEDVRELDSWYPVAHIPVDEIILKAVLEKGVVNKRPCPTWSSWNDWNAYLEFQNTIRTYAAERGIMPIALETQLWQ